MSDNAIELSDNEYDIIPFMANPEPFMYPIREYDIIKGESISLCEDSIQLQLVHPSKREKQAIPVVKFIILSPKWARFLREGNKLYDHLLYHYDKMIYKDMIPHFYIKPEGHYIGDVYKLNEEHGEELEESILLWIHTEKESGRLFHKEHWKPFPSYCEYNDMYYGYRILFLFRNIYYQLTIEDECDICLCTNGHPQDDCWVTHFSVIVYEKEDRRDCTVTSHHWIPAMDWGKIYYK
jgi:hypothetical protein